MTLARLSDQELLDSLDTLCFETRRLLGRLLLHLIEVEDRRLDLRSACSSLYDFCIRRLGMSESEACRRIEAARLVKRFPLLLEALERGDLNLTALLLLKNQFTTDNVEALSVAARGKTKREVQELVAARSPKPDAFPTLTEVQAPLPARLEPLSPTRHRLELTISGDLREKLERLRYLLGHRIPGGDLEGVLEEAVDARLAQLEKERPKIAREVLERDGEQCTYADEKGNRCGSRTRLEIDHIVPRALGGPDEIANRRVLCRAHNRLVAEQAFGREHVARQIHLRQRGCEETSVEVATRALVNMGFRERDVRRKLREAYPPGASLPPMPELLRQALRLLG